MKFVSANLIGTRSGAAIHVLLAFVFVLSALAWAWHVDVPVTSDGQTQVSAADHTHMDNGDLIDRCDHCCHAGAHLVALVSKPAVIGFDNTFAFAAAIDARLTQQQADPPYIPPIA